MQRKRRLQNKIAVSRFSLPITATLIALIWVAVGLLRNSVWIQLGIMVLSTLLMVELNNRNALMRTYSRMVSCSFLVLITMSTLPQPTIGSGIATLCFIAFYLLVWNTYQNKKDAGNTFFAFACLGIASTQFIQIIFLVPFIWIMMQFFVLSLSIRTFCASLVGLLAPYWFLSVYYFLKGDIMDLIAHFAQLSHYPTSLDYSQISVTQAASVAFITIIFFMGIVHFLRNSYADKIRTRMIYESLIFMNFVTLALIILQPQHYADLIGIMVVNTSPLIAHFITFTQTRITNITFITILIMASCLILLNIWMPSSVFL